MNLTKTQIRDDFKFLYELQQSFQQYKIIMTDIFVLTVYVQQCKLNNTLIRF